MAYEKSESAQDTFAKFFHQFQPKTYQETSNDLNKIIYIYIYIFRERERKKE